jgi:segregation and condensation protein B
MDSRNLKNIVEAAMLAAGNPLTIDQLRALFGEQDPPEKQDIRGTLQELKEDYESRGIEIREVASGFRIQVRQEMSQWLGKLWEERPPRYSRALMETLAIIAYRQPVTRGDVEEIRGVSVTTNIIRTLLERNWIKVLGHRDVPGKPAMFGTTREFLDYFSLKKLDDLPPLAELAEMDHVSVQLELGAPEMPVTEEEAIKAKLETEAGEDASDEIVAGEDNAAAELGQDVDQEAAAEGDVVLPVGEHENADDVTTQATVEGAATDGDSELADSADVEILGDTVEVGAQPLDIVAAEQGLESGDDEQEQSATALPDTAETAGDDLAESGNVTSLDDARAAAAEANAENSEVSSSDETAEIVPIKTS